MTKVSIINELNLVKLEDTTLGNTRYINIDNLVMISKILDGNKSKIAFNFQNTISISGESDLSKKIPEFQYVFDIEEKIEDIYSLISFRLKDKKEFVELETIKGNRIINLTKINSWLEESANDSLYINFNTSIYTQKTKPSSKEEIVSMSLKCPLKGNKEKLIEGLTRLCENK